MARIHFVPQRPAPGASQHTACGIQGWYHTADEFDKADGGRFEATSTTKNVTCKTCQKGPGFKLWQSKRI